MIKDNDLYFAKVNPNAIIPSKRDEDGGYDVYACFDEDYMVIQPHETKLIPSGIATAFHHFVANRWRNSGNSEKLFPKSLQMVTPAMKLKEACSLEAKL